MKYPVDFINKIICGDSIKVMKDIPNDVIDSVICDPPYEIGFMNKLWDNSGIAYNVDLWKQCLRVLKPGGYLLSFGGARTYHRMACAIEDAGFEIRDMIEWIYGQGFPKSLDISKAVDKQGGKSLSWFIDYILKVADERKISRKELTMLFPSKNGNSTGWLWNKQKTQNITIKQYNKIKNFLDLPFENLKEAEREVIGKGKAGLTAGSIANFAGKKEFNLTTPTTSQAKQWEGWGTNLKPAHEPVCMARKPLSEKTVAENVLKWGTGGINIDECRVEIDSIKDASQLRTMNRSQKDDKNGWGMNQNKGDNPEVISPKGRFPANIIHDGSDEVMKVFPNTSKGWGVATNGKAKGKGSMFGTGGTNANRYDMDGSSAARFFYCPKASKSERDMGCEELEKKTAGECTDRKNGSAGLKSPRAGAGRTNGSKNYHPAVKPIKLMEYLVKLVTVKDALVLDSFIGSGTTAIACKKLKRNFIGIELYPEYVEIARKRTSRVQVELF